MELSTPRYQSSVHQDSQPWGSPTGSGCLAEQSPPGTPNGFCPEAQGAQMKRGWLPCSNRSQAWSQGERGLGQLICKKDCLSCRCRPLPAKEVAAWAQNLHGVTQSTMLQTHRMTKVTPHQHEQEGAFNHIQWEQRTMERAETHVRFLAGWKPPPGKLSPSSRKWQFLPCTQEKRDWRPLKVFGKHPKNHNDPERTKISSDLCSNLPSIKCC